MFEKPFFVILTNRCNLACPHCYNELDDIKSRKTKEYDTLSRERLQDLFYNLIEQGYKKGYFSGGEVLLRPDTPNILADAHGRGLKSALFTNGHLFSEDIIAYLKESGLDEVRISLNELAWIKNRAQYEKIFAKQTRWVKHLVTVGLSVGIVYIISGANSQYVIETLRRVREMGAGMKVQPLFLPDHLSGRSRVTTWKITEEEWNQMIDGVVAYSEKTDYKQEEAHYKVYNNPWKILRYIRFLKDFFLMGARPDYCPTGPILVLDSDGYFHPCLFRFDLVCGHISEDDTVKNIREIVDNHEELRTAPCFKEECLSAYR